MGTSGTDNFKAHLLCIAALAREVGPSNDLPHHVLSAVVQPGLDFDKALSWLLNSDDQ